jgi:hypothetical protein
LKRLDQDEEDTTPLTQTQRNRSDLIKRICRIVARSHTNGIGRNAICRSIHALNTGYSQKERDDLFGYIEQEAEADDIEVDIFLLKVEESRKNGRPVNKPLYFSKKTWSPEQAVAVLPVAVATWTNGGFKDALGKVHAELRDCAGYKPAWETEVVKGVSSSN